MGLWEALQHLLKSRTEEKEPRGPNRVSQDPKVGVSVAGHRQCPLSPSPITAQKVMEQPVEPRV